MKQCAGIEILGTPINCIGDWFFVIIWAIVLASVLFVIFWPVIYNTFMAKPADRSDSPSPKKVAAMKALMKLGMRVTHCSERDGEIHIRARQEIN